MSIRSKENHNIMKCEAIIETKITKPYPEGVRWEYEVVPCDGEMEEKGKFANTNELAGNWGHSEYLHIYQCKVCKDIKIV